MTSVALVSDGMRNDDAGSPNEVWEMSDGESGSQDPASGEPVSRVETGLILPVAELESFLVHWRAEVDAVPPAGVPAHISLLYPFLPPDTCVGQRVEVAEFFGKIEPFDFWLTEVGWFDGRVVFLRPDDPAPFLDVTEQLVARWTQCLPYGGKHAELVPHLTLGIEGSESDMQELAAAATALLPIRCRVTEAWLMIGTPRPPKWEISEKFELGG